MDVRSLLLDRLPTGIQPLRGSARCVFLGFWAILLGLVLYGGAMDLLRQETVQPTLSELYGLEPNYVVDPGRLIEFPASSEAMRVGVRAGDRIAAVNGLKLNDDFGVGNALATLGFPAAATFSMISADGAAHRYRLANDPVSYADGFRGCGVSRAGQMAISNGLNVIFTLIVPAALAVLLMIRRSRDPLAP